jgi:hypothetical protein
VDHRHGRVAAALERLVKIGSAAADAYGTDESGRDELFPASLRALMEIIVVEIVLVGEEILVELVAVADALRQTPAIVEPMIVARPALMPCVLGVVTLQAVGGLLGL